VSVTNNVGVRPLQAGFFYGSSEILLELSIHCFNAISPTKVGISHLDIGSFMEELKEVRESLIDGANKNIVFKFILDGVCKILDVMIRNFIPGAIANSAIKEEMGEKMREWQKRGAQGDQSNPAECLLQ